MIEMARLFIVAGPILVVISLVMSLVFCGLELGGRAPNPTNLNWATGTVLAVLFGGALLYLTGGAVLIWPDVIKFIGGK